MLNFSFFSLILYSISVITPTLSWGGEGAKKLSPEEGWKGMWRKKAHVAHLWGPGLEPGTYHVLGEGPQLHAMGVV